MNTPPEENKQWFDQIEHIIADNFRFKSKLRIGEDAFTTNRWRKKAFELLNAAGMAGTAAVVVKSAPVASTLFAPIGMLSFLGIGTAVTPVGWVVTSAMLAGFGWIGITRYVREKYGDNTVVVPNFINTPVDVLAMALFDLMAPLSLKLASIDGQIDPAEREVIIKYFVKEWGFDAKFVNEGIAFTEDRLPTFSIKELAQSLAQQKIKNKDCNYREMSREFVDFLTEIMEADGKIDPQEQILINDVKKIFEEAGQPISHSIKTGMSKTISSTSETLVKINTKTTNATTRSANKLMRRIRPGRGKSI